MVVNPETSYVTCLTTEQLVTLWGPDGATTWDQVNPEYPSDPVEIFAPGVDSGTYDFFNETIEVEEPRQDFNASEDDNVIVQGVQGTPGAWGYFGFAFFQENAETLQAVEYDGGEGCVAPSVETAQDGSYLLTRPLFIYVKNESLSRPEVADYATFYVENVGSIIESVGYIPATEDEIAEAATAVEEAIGG
jgi:phosphate transport system substrate-binding protein